MFAEGRVEPVCSSWMLVWLTVIVSFVGVYLVWFMQQMRRRPCPGPTLYPFLWGLPLAIYHVRNNSLFDSIVANAAAYGLTWSFRFPGRPNAVETCDKDNVRHILVDNFRNYQKPPDVKRDFEPVFGKRGIFIADGLDWKNQRKTASHMFKVRSLRTMIPIFNKHANDIVDFLAEAAKADGVVDVQRCFSDYTLASILEIAFGVHWSVSEFALFHFHFDRVQANCFLRIMSPFYRVRNALGFPSQVERDLAESSLYMRTVAETILKARKDTPRDVLAESDDLLSRYLLLGSEPDELIVDVLLNFMVAGRDTTTVTTSFAVYLLAKNPAKFKICLAELQERYPDGVDPTLKFEDTDESLPYLSGVVRETLRLYPAVPSDPKFAIGDDVLPSGVKINAGTIVVWHAFAMGRTPVYWDNPEEFRPERWTRNDNGGLAVPAANSGPWTPFQDGPRICLGMRMALCEVHALLIKVLLRFDFEVINDPILVPQITLAAKDGIQLIVKNRL